MKKKLLLEISFLLLLAVPALAQNKLVKGIITDASNKSALINVSVTVPGTNIGTTTDNTGQFSIEVPQNTKTLNVSFVSYQSQLVEITGNSLVIALVADSKGLEEVVVIGYGTQKKKDLTGAISTISAKDVGGRQTVQISEALQGSIAGVNVSRSSSRPGAGSAIRVRGITTTTAAGNEPLIIVDGIQVSNIDNINPNDVENLTVLKDAASAAIYGSQASGGVILITTKRAKEGQASLEYNYEYGAQKPTSLPKFVGVQDYMRYFNEQATNDGAATGPYAQAFINSYLDSNRVNPDKFPNTDWQKVILSNSTAPRHRHDLTLTMGTAKVKTKLSFGYQKVGAFYDNYDYTRYLFRANNDLQINNKLSASLDIAYKRTLSNSTIATPGYGDPIYESRVLPPIYDDYYSDGRYAFGKDGRNPIAQIYDGGYAKSNLNQVVGRFVLNFKPIKNLTLTALFSPSFDFDKSKTYSKQIKFTDLNDPSRVVFTNVRSTTSLNEGRSENLRLNGQFLANYKKTIAKNHTIEGLVGYEELYNYFESIGASRDGFALLGFPYLSVGSQEFRDNSGGASESSLRSFFGRVNYNFDEKYFIQANLRYDQSSRFAPEFRNAYFPSVSAGWVLSREKFMDKIEWLSFLKIRGSYGEVGNERIGNYPYQATFAPSTALFYTGSAVVPLTGYAQQDYVIRNISWESTSTADVGIDAAFLKNRLSVTADYFKRTTTDMLAILNIPDYVGYNDPIANQFSLSSKGWEFEASWKDRFGKLNYSVAANISDAKTKIIDVSRPNVPGSLVNFVGEEFNSWYGYRAIGIFQDAAEVTGNPAFPNTKPGDVRYADLNKDGKITSDGDRVLLGGSLPRYLYGGNIRMDYKDFDFGLVFQGVAKKLSQMPSESIQPFAEAFGNMAEPLVGRFWSPNNTAEQNKNAKFPRLSRTSNTNNYQLSDKYLMNAAYFRVKNISLGYTLPRFVLKKLGVQSFRVYSSVNDVFTISKLPKYINTDPEVGNLGYPIVTTVIVGATIRF